MHCISFLFGGLFQIRTGVNGFADRYLTTRPRDPLLSGSKNTIFFEITSS